MWEPCKPGAKGGPCVYLFHAGDTAKYVGETGSLCQRLWQHSKAIERFKLNGMYLPLPKIPGPFRMIVEEFLIVALKPELNVKCKNRLTDEGVYTYLKAMPLVLSVDQLQAISHALERFGGELSDECLELLGSLCSGVAIESLE